MKSLNILQFNLEIRWTGMSLLMYHLVSLLILNMYMKYMGEYVNNAAHVASTSAHQVISQYKLAFMWRNHLCSTAVGNVEICILKI